MMNHLSKPIAIKGHDEPIVYCTISVLFFLFFACYYNYVHSLSLFRSIPNVRLCVDEAVGAAEGFEGSERCAVPRKSFSNSSFVRSRCVNECGYKFIYFFIGNM